MTEQKANPVLLEQVNLLSRRTPVIVVGTVLATGILVSTLSSWFPLRPLLIWSAAVVALSLFRLWVFRRHLDQPVTTDTVVAREIILTLHSGLSGSLWGVAGYLFVDASHPVASILIVMVLTGMVASAIASLSVVLPAFYAFMIPSFSPAVFRFYSFGDEVYITIATLILIFMLASFYFAIGNYRTMRDSIQLRFDNLDLISNLSQEKQNAEEARIKAESANLAKSKFLAAASHDLRQPMHALRLFTTELKERTQKSEYQSIVTNIGLSVEALEGLFNALLDISKLDAGTLTVKKEHFSLRSLFDRLKHDYAGQASEKSLALEIGPTTAIVYSDSTLLERILRNLLSNALSYTNGGKVSICTVQKDGELTIQVQDTGQGIDLKNQKKIFEEFVQLHNPQRDRNNGLGLGLSIVRRIALLLEHPLTLDSALGCGSVFSVTIPLGNESAISLVEIFQDSEQDCSQLFALVIEDDPAVREGLGGLMKHWRCTILAVSSIDEALLKLADYEYAPDVILSDYRLPNCTTGIEAITTIRSKYGLKIPALIMTGDTAPDRLKETHASAIPLMHKPFEPRQLKAFLNSVNQQKKLAEQGILDLDSEV